MEKIVKEWGQNWKRLNKEINEKYEDYEEPKELDYWCVEANGEILQCHKPEYIIHLLDKQKEIGNYFDTREEAEKAVEKLKAWKRLKDKGFKLDAVVDSFFCLDIYMRDEPYKAIKDDLKIVFGGKE